jgi:Vault protein inter-alpha-trypsin domain/Flp pilus assembly protein RcpC/CpaB/FecR protein
MTPFDQNLERLLKEAYQPETPDPVFVAGLSERLLATARERAVVETGERRTLHLRRFLGTIMAIAAVNCGIFLIRHIQPVRESASPLIPVGRSELANNAAEKPEHLTPQPKPESLPLPLLSVGKQLRTDARRTRVRLPDGSELFVSHDSAVRLDSERRLVLEQGEIYVEVAQKDGERFVVQTPDRTVTALGTRFDVRADGKTSVVVTQGKVQVSGLSSLLYAGQQLMPDEDRAAPAPRASAVIDWTRDLMSEGLVPSSKYCGGALLAYDSAGQEAKISLRRFHLDVHIEDGFARTTIDQTYFNHESAQLEGTFYFPLPADSSISRLAMYVNGNLMEGGMAEREHARNTFEQIRYTRRDPALLEWLDGSTFKMRVFPLEGRHEKRIVLSYTQRMPVLHGKASYRFPMGHNLQVVGDWSANVKVVGGAAQSWASPSHTLEATARDGSLTLTASAKSVKLDRDLQLELSEQKIAPTRFAQAELDGHRYLMLRHRPEITNHQSSIINQERRHFVFLFETSADRDPLLARTQIEILRTLLENLEHTDTFQVLTAATRTKRINDTPVPAVRENIDATIEALDKTHLIGAFDLENAMAAADPFLRDALGQNEAASSLNPPVPPPSRGGKGGVEGRAADCWLVHIGSGIAALGERRADVLAGRIPEGAHYAGIGVGKRWSRPFMKTAAARTGGHYTQINPDEPVQWRAFDFLASLKLPRWQNLTATDDSGREWLLTDFSLCAGEELCAATRLGVDEALPKKVTIRGQIDGKKFEHSFGLGAQPLPRPLPEAGRGENQTARSAPLASALPSKGKGDQSSPLSPASGERGRGEGVEIPITPNAGYIPRTWGRLEIDRLMAANSDANKQKIIDLSKSLYVMSPYTSLLVLENDQMYQQFKIDRGRKDHWAMYPCPEKIADQPEPLPSNASPVEDKTALKSERTVRDVLQSIMVRNVAPLGQPHTEAYKPMTAWDPGQTMMASPYYLEHRPRYFRPDPDFPLEKELAEERDRLIPADEQFSRGFYPPALALVPNGQYRRYRPTVKYPRERSSFEPQLTSGEFRPLGFLNDPRARGVVEGLTPLGSITTDLDIPLRSSSFNRATPPTLSKIPYINRLYQSPPNSIGGIGGLGGGLGGFGGGGLGGFGGGGSFVGVNGANGFGGFNGANYFNSANFNTGFNGFGMGGQVGFGAGQLGFNGNWSYQPFSSNGWAAQFNGFQGQLGYLYGQFGNGFPPNGNQYLYMGAPLAERARWWETTSGLPMDEITGAPLKAMAIRANPDMVGGGIVVPGSRVDVINVERQPGGRTTSTTLLRNVLVVGVDVATSRNDPGPAVRSSQIVNDRGTSNNGGQTVTLAVNQPDSVRLVLAQERGQVSLMLRDSTDGRANNRLRPHADLKAGPFAPVDPAALLYQQPTVNGINAQLLFRDLVAFAPGMETSQADILATIEAEAALEAVKLGRIDDAARKLIDAARATGWRRNSIKLDDATLNIVYDGAGRFAYDRVLPTGLREIVVCDGATLLHLYPEIGLARSGR